MSASCAKSPQGRRLVRKSVPDGSSDFQRALDTFLSSSESDDSGENNDENNEAFKEDCRPIDLDKKSSRYKYIVIHDENEDRVEEHAGEVDIYEYCDDFEDCDEDTSVQNTHEQSSRVNKKSKKLFSPNSGKSSPRKHDHNNNTSKSICTCGRDLSSVIITCTDFESSYKNPRYAWGHSRNDALLSPRERSEHKQEANSDFVDKTDSVPLKLPSITAHLHPQPVPTSPSGMGINCSANIEDTKEFSNVLSDRTATHIKHKKLSRMGGTVAKGNNLEKQSHSIDSSGSEHCSCEHHDDGKKTSGHTNKVNSNGNSPKSPTAKDSLTNSNKRSSSLPGRGSSKTATSTPQRLLTSRNRSPNGYLRSSGSMDAGVDMRARSHSWSNGRSISQTRQGPIRPITKNTSLFPRTLVLGPSGIRSPHSLRHHDGSDMKKTLSSSPTQPDNTLGTSSPSPVAHLPGCPLFVSADLSSDTKKKVAISDTNTEDSPDGSSDADLSPVQRPRAASESHTSQKIRVQQHLLDLPRPRSNTMSEGSTRGLSPSSDLDHGVHVHWADEEQGLSLSTSVLLTSIRPRSYSHGAVDGRPHRPILKKVAGL